LTYEAILSQVFEVLQKFLPEGKTLSEETELVADLGLASMQVMELMLEIEDHFDISIPLNILPDVRTVKDLVRQLQQLMSRS